jgi:hypothetical protein
MNTTAFLAIIGRIPPQAWDAIIPHGARVSVRNPAELVALNPQPLPPREAYLVAAAEMAHSVASLAVEADVRGEQSGFVSEFIDDWCGTPWPKKWPWPWPGPGEGPDPEPWIETGRAIGAIVFASVGARLGEGELGTALLEGAEQLAEASLARQVA